MAIAELFAAVPGAAPVPATRVPLDDPHSVWFVEAGQLDVFAVEQRDGATTGARRFAWSVEAPGLMFGITPAPGDRTFGLLAVGASETRLRQIPLEAVRDLAGRTDTAPAISLMLETFVARAAAAMGQPAFDRSDEGNWDHLRHVGGHLPQWLIHSALAAEAAEHARFGRKAEAERDMLSRGVVGLAHVLALDVRTTPVPVAGNALLAACQAVGERAGIEFQPAPSWEVERRVRDPLSSICRASRVRQRRVALRANWWRSSGAPLLGYLNDDKRPVALLPIAHTRYELFDPASGQRVVVDEGVSASIEPLAFELYRPSPDRAMTLGDLGRLALTYARGDIARLLLTALAGGLLGLVTPLALAKIFSDVIPMAVPANILPLLTTLVAFTLASTFFDLTRAIALIRIGGRTNVALQATVIDRLLALQVPFFRRFAVGDLAMRAGAINAARELLSGTVITTLLAGSFSVVNLVLLFYYSWQLTLVALATQLLSIAFTSALAIATIRVERRRQAANGVVAGLIFEIIGGIAKLRVAGAEGRAFAVWARKFRIESELAYRAGVYENWVEVFNSVLPIVSRTLLLGTTGYLLTSGIAVHTGDFVAFNAAFGAFLGAGIQMSSTLINALHIVPIMERARPILEARLETSAAKPDPGELTGQIEISHVSFRYKADGPAILRDVSLRAAPGQFVALVGPSGSGKSTLLRLLLGFEQPESGAIFFDEQELGLVDLTAVRSQMGVVLQSSRLLAGDMFQNIVGSSPLTLDDAWAAAEMAGLAGDIREMPMGMNTVVSEGGSTLSGGQRQRLMIARALVRRPRIVLFDEATSALDNRTQEIVTTSLANMQATRIVIAHRLSTVRHADRIFVMEAGQVVQQGSYEELAQAPGLFARMMARQVI
jgi:NHLM bacteriocin system ABC transporter ATP-binding protein